MRTNPVGSAIVATLAILFGCSEPVGVESPASSNIASAAAMRGGLAPLVLVNQNGAPPPHTNAPVVADLASALALVSPGGTIRVFDGTYITQQVLVDRAVTIEAASGAHPTLDAAGSTRILDVAAPLGLVTLRNLRFVGALDEAVNTETVDPTHLLSYDRLLLEGVSMVIPGDQLHGNFGLNIGPSTTAGAGVIVRHSSFTGGQVGAIANGSGAHMEVYNSTTSDQAHSGIQFQLGATGRAEENKLSECGVLGCIRMVLTGDVVVKANTMTLRRSRGQQAGIFARPNGAGATITIDANQIVDTRDEFDATGGAPTGIRGGGDGNIVVTNNHVDGLNGIGLTGGTSIRIEHNDIRVMPGDHVFDGITVNTDPAILRRIVVRANSIIGAGVPSDASDPNAYLFTDGGIEIDAVPVSGGPAIPQTVDVSGNTIRNALRGITAFAGASVVGKDNVVSVAFFGLTSYTGSQNAVTRSDITSYFAATDGDGVFTIPCNWWGSAAGPHDPGTAALSSFVPWATRPIAHTEGWRSRSPAESCGRHQRLA